MKTYEEMAQSALTRGNAIRKERNKRNKIFFATLSGFAACCLMILLVAGIGEKGLNLRPTRNPIRYDDPPLEDPAQYSITLDSLAELDEMREMISCTDEKTLNSYLSGIRGRGARSRDDLIAFVNLMDSLPILELIEGEITWISHEGISFHSTDKSDEVVFISTKAANGDWTRVEYLVWEKDVNAEIAHRKASGEFKHSTIDRPIQSNDGRIKVYSEVREAHPSGIGYTISWNVVVDGILIRVVYYSENIDDIQAETVFDDLIIRTLNTVSYLQAHRK